MTVHGILSMGSDGTVVTTRTRQLSDTVAYFFQPSGYLRGEPPRLYLSTRARFFASPLQLESSARSSLPTTSYPPPQHLADASLLAGSRATCHTARFLRLSVDGLDRLATPVGLPGRNAMPSFLASIVIGRVLLQSVRMRACAPSPPHRRPRPQGDLSSIAPKMIIRQQLPSGILGVLHSTHGKDHHP